MGLAWLIPAAAAWAGRGSLSAHDLSIAALGPILILAGAGAIAYGFSSLQLRTIPSPVRAAMTGNALFIAFCALEFSDGLLRQGGRVFYWTSVCFVPALIVFYGQVLAQRWAWWMARLVAALFSAWFTVFLLMVPFVQLRGSGGAVPWWGRIYVATVTLVFASISIYAFRSLGRNEARRFYGVVRNG